MKGWFVKLFLVLIFVALVANIVVAALRRSEGGFISADVIRAMAYGVIVAANLFIAGAGVYFTARTRQKSGKTSALWGIRAFVVNLVVTVVLAIAPFLDPTDVIYNQFSKVSMVLLLIGLSNAAFLYAFYRDYLRTVGSSRSRSRRYRSTAMTTSPPAPTPASKE